jgi:nicotinate phosphoribosyltransferase
MILYLIMITNNHKVSPLSTDLYQFTCSYAYYECGKHEEIATFECFYRKNPFKGEYCILAGIK